MRAVDRVIQQRTQCGRAVAQIVHGFKQRRDVQRHGTTRCGVAGLARQCQYGEHVRRALRHADDVQADGIRAVGFRRLAQLPEHRKTALCDFAGLVRERGRAASVAAQQLGLLVRCTLRPGGIAQQLGDGGGVYA